MEQAAAAVGYYAALVGLMRVAGKRLANAAVFIATVFSTHLVTARMCRQFPALKRLVRGAPRPLVVNGRVFHAALEEKGPDACAWPHSRKPDISVSWLRFGPALDASQFTAEAGSR